MSDATFMSGDSGQPFGSRLILQISKDRAYALSIYLMKDKELKTTDNA
jgi:hypothetical protein